MSMGENLFFQTESLFQRFESMIKWDDEREQRRQLLLGQITEGTTITDGKEIKETLISIPTRNFQSNNASKFSFSLWFFAKTKFSLVLVCSKKIFTICSAIIISKWVRKTRRTSKRRKSVLFEFSYRSISIRFSFVFVEKLRNITSKICV